MHDLNVWNWKEIEIHACTIIHCLVQLYIYYCTIDATTKVENGARHFVKRAKLARKDHALKMRTTFLIHTYMRINNKNSVLRMQIYSSA